MNEFMPPLAVSSAFMSDHLSRLYRLDLDDRTWRHIDQPDSVIVPKWARTVIIDATIAAVRELADDADYQWEFTEEPAYRAQARRVRDRARAHLVNWKREAS